MKVYITNKGAHNFEAAKVFGQFHFLSKGSMNRYSTNRMYRMFVEALEDSKEDDYLLPTGLSTMNLIAAVIFALKHKRLNLLLFKDGSYVERTLMFDEVGESYKDLENVLQFEGAKALLKER